ncbi:MAG: hypothetical protein SPI35_05915 [Porphyromonas sp.]|nr:hypothetical protein [Porphyromonas sp.]
MEKKSPTLFERTPEQVRTLGVLGYSVPRVVDYFTLTDRERDAFFLLLTTPGNAFYTAYHEGLQIGEFNTEVTINNEIKKGSIEAVELQRDLRTEKENLTLRKKMFGV